MKKIIEFLLSFSFRLEEIVSKFLVLRLITFICFGYSTGVMRLQFALYLLVRTFIALVSSKAIFSFFRFALPKIKLIWNSINLNFPLWLIFSVGLFGFDGVLPQIAAELAQALCENQEAKELEGDLFKEIEQEDPETEIPVEDLDLELDEKTSDPNVVWVGVAILIAVKLAMLIWFS